MSITGKGRAFAATAAAAVIAASFTALPASATPAGDSIVINEVNVSSKFVELYNPTDKALSIAGSQIGYYSKAGNLQCPTAGTLSGSIPAKGYLLVQMGNAAQPGVPTADVVWDCSAAIGGNGGYAFGTSPLSATVGGNVATQFTDFLGLGSHVAFEGAAASAPSSGKSAARSGAVDTDNNAADFTAQDSTPTNSSGNGGTVEPTTEPTVEPTTEPTTNPTAGATTAIAEIQGTGSQSPLAEKTVTTEGYVTAVYPTGGFDGIYLQTAGTGGGTNHTGASHGIFIYGNKGNLATSVAVGDYLTVTGPVNEYYELTQVTAASFSKVTPPSGAVAPKAVEVESLPSSAAERESLEGMLVKVTGPMTVTDNFSTNQYGTVGIAMGTKSLRQPTDVLNPTRDGNDAVQAIEDSNAARRFALDDGMTTDFLKSTENKAIPVSWLTPDNEVRVGAAVTQTAPAVMDYRNSEWRLQPLKPMTGPTGIDPSAASFDFSSTRPSESPAVGGDVSIASFNVLNYFTTTAADAKCTSLYRDRENNPITANKCDTVRGAANDVNLKRQQDKIVAAINKVDSSVLSLAEIENSAKNKKDRDYSVNQLVTALNTQAGFTKWAAVPSAPKLPSLAEEDVIRLAFIYQPAEVKMVGSSQVLVGDAAFGNAREPLGQTFKAIDKDGKEYGEDFVVVVNHFKSKGSGTAAPDKWQGNANADRVKQSAALAKWIDKTWAGEPVFIVGDLNAYSAEDPIVTLNDAGYTRVLEHMYNVTGNDAYMDEITYQFKGLTGSLDQALGNEAALKMVTDAGIYSINAEEALAREYSRYNYNATNFYNSSEFRSSDHDPVKIGVNVDGKEDVTTVTPVAPPFADGTITIPTVSGVTYKVDDKVVTGTINVAKGQTVVVTAEAARNFIFPEGVTKSWTFTVKDGSSQAPGPISAGDNVFFQDKLTTTQAQFGMKVDLSGYHDALAGDFDGDGIDTLVLRAGNAYTFLDSNTGAAKSYTVTFGRADDDAAIADINGDGKDDIVVRRQFTNEVFVQYNVGGAIAGGTADDKTTFGSSPGYYWGNRYLHDRLVAGDWTGSGKAGIGVHRKFDNDNSAFIKNTFASGNADFSYFLGSRGYIETTVGDFDGNGTDVVASVSYPNVVSFENVPFFGTRETYRFGRAGDLLIAGDWFGTGSDTLLALRW